MSVFLYLAFWDGDSLYSPGLPGSCGPPPLASEVLELYRFTLLYPAQSKILVHQHALNIERGMYRLGYLLLYKLSVYITFEKKL